MHAGLYKPTIVPLDESRLIKNIAAQAREMNRVSSLEMTCPSRQRQGKGRESESSAE